jgi:F-box protein 18 (helicase)
VFAITQILPSRKGDNLFIRAKLVLDTLKVFFSSADENITIEHTPSERMNEKNLMVDIEDVKRNVSRPRQA